MNLCKVLGSSPTANRTGVKLPHVANIQSILTQPVREHSGLCVCWGGGIIGLVFIFHLEISHLSLNQMKEKQSR